MNQIWQRLFGLNLAKAEHWRNQSIRLASSYHREDRRRNSRFLQHKRDSISEDVEPEAQHEYNEGYDRPLFEQEDPRYSRSKKHKSNKNSSKIPAETIPNLLMWSQKEQIKSLYEGDSEQWPMNRLSGSFPASIATIKKILRSKWKPEDVNIHDERAKKHWRQLLNGEIDVSPALKRHLLSFLPKELQQQKESSLTTSTDDTEKINLAEKVNDDENEAKQVSTITPKYQSITKYDVKKVDVVKEKPQFEEWINIPKDKWKEGATYKVGDAYYHSDGTFLYRVPGLT